MSEYIGYEVEIVTAGSGTVSGIVVFYDDIRIDLTNVKIDGRDFPQPALSFK